MKNPEKKLCKFRSTMEMLENLSMIIQKNSDENFLKNNHGNVGKPVNDNSDKNMKNQTKISCRKIMEMSGNLSMIIQTKS